MRRSMILKSLAFAAALLTPTVAVTETVAITTGDYEPFVSSSAADGGPVNNLITRVFEHAGYATEFKFMPWKRALELTRRGRHDASSFWYYKEERNAEFYHAGPLFNDNLVFFRVKSDTPLEWNTLSDLAGLKIGVVDGYTYTPELWDLGRGGVLQLEAGPSDEANLRKLLAGRLDLYPLSEPTGVHLLNEAFTPEERARIEILEKSLSVTVAYLLISKKVEGAEQMAEDFNAALTALRAEGALPEIVEALSQR